MKNELDKSLQVFLKQQAQIARIMEPFQAQQAQFAALTKPFRAQQAQIAALTEPFRAQQAQIARLIEPFQAQQVQIARIMEPFRAQQAQIDKLLKPISEHLLNGNFDNIERNQDGSLSFEGCIVDVGTLNDCINEITNESDTTDFVLSNLVKWFNSLSDSLKVVVAVLLLPYCVSIFANLTTPIYEGWWQEITTAEQRTAKKEIIKEANQLYLLSELNEYRFVIASVLHVRESGNRKSEIVGELYLGKAVKVISKLKRWTLVEYFDESSEEIKQGWVFSRYLEKFSK
ncbi:TPA: SH3 domain-containing protein [Photobacterium damselae]